jgi:hypothetical protein
VAGPCLTAALAWVRMKRPTPTSDLPPLTRTACLFVDEVAGEVSQADSARALPREAVSPREHELIGHLGNGDLLHRGLRGMVGGDPRGPDLSPGRANQRSGVVLVAALFSTSAWEESGEPGHIGSLARV